ncbi:MAG TPA: DNRLRE domain-containing protein [Methanotrichaceae archaeon]|nr:DNRLRE domain-containing protein [Methanotrichaceae archaeon]HQF17306.1 DNRLRE domain-containing protein [Methanotrichaceae archaeon]HQI91948.1 DNRLRE domain-containing protein [Methanotrichaceae archaeon]HQJ29273.1 DNRLRE domain-containing protein [Methanotrichaceae archaeon]
MRYVCLIVALALTTGICLAGTFTSPVDTDTYLDKDDPNSTFSEEDLLWASSVGGEPNKIVYLGYMSEVFGNQGIRSSEQIESATLTLTVAEVATAGTVTAYFLKDWTSPELTWMDRSDNYDTESAVEIEVDEAGPVTVDATVLVKKAVESCTTGCPYTIVLIADGDASVAFESKDSSAAATELKYKTF